jgi:hypothetical protein
MKLAEKRMAGGLRLGLAVGVGAERFGSALRD